MTDKIIKSPRLPSLPSVAVQLLQLMSDPEACLRDMVELIRTDAAISAKLLSAANSPRYGTGRQVTDLGRATVLMGKSTVAALALTFTVADASLSSGKAGAAYRRCWQKFILRALSAEALARAYHPGREGECFVAGLLSGIGQLAMLKTSPDDYLDVLDESFGSRLPLWMIEQQTLGKDHVQVAAEMLESLSIPATLIDAISLQYVEVEDARRLATSLDRDLIATTAVAASFSDYLSGERLGASLVRLNELAEYFFEACPQTIERLIDEISEHVEDVSSLFDLDENQLNSPTDLMAAAMDQLAELAIADDVSQPVDDMSHKLSIENGQLKHRVEELSRQSTTDQLTGVLNRRAFDEQLTVRIAAARESGDAAGLMFADVDHFKNINDTYGHIAGDCVLKAVAQYIQKCLRSDDLVARYGGEEFVIIPVHADLATLQTLAERIRTEIESSPVAFYDHLIPVTVSIGGVKMSPREDVAVESNRLIEAADSAMYLAKNRGRNQVVIRQIWDNTCPQPHDVSRFS